MNTENAENSVRRPNGVSLIAGMNLILGVVMLVMALNASGPHAEPGVMFFGGVISGVLGLGLWGLRPWARWLAIIAYGINIAGALAQPNPIATVIAGSLMAYLAFNEDVRRAFAKKMVELPADTQPTSLGPVA